MCKFKSGLIFKNRVVLAPENNESHSALLESLGIEDTRENAMRKFIRAELIPNDENKAVPIEEWEFIVDQDITPEWYEEDPKKYETEFRNAVKEYIEQYMDKNNIVKFADRFWTPIKRDENRVYYLLDGTLMDSRFGESNNYAVSVVREKLINSDLAKKLKEEFGDKLVPIKTDLLSLDGLDDYGKVEGDIIAIPTIDLYRECRKQFTKVNKWTWLATADSTPSGFGSGYVRDVDSDGSVRCNWYDYVGAVRCFIIVES